MVVTLNYLSLKLRAHARDNIKTPQPPPVPMGGGQGLRSANDNKLFLIKCGNIENSIYFTKSTFCAVAPLLAFR